MAAEPASDSSPAPRPRHSHVHHIVVRPFLAVAGPLFVEHVDPAKATRQVHQTILRTILGEFSDEPQRTLRHQRKPKAGELESQWVRLDTARLTFLGLCAQTTIVPARGWRYVGFWGSSGAMAALKLRLGRQSPTRARDLTAARCHPIPPAKKHIASSHTVPLQSFRSAEA